MAEALRCLWLCLAPLGVQYAFRDVGSDGTLHWKVKKFTECDV